MNRKNLPLLLMLTAGAVTCIITYIQQYPLMEKLILLFVALLFFWLMGCALEGTLNYFDSQNEERLKEEGEVIEKEPEGADGEAGEKVLKSEA